MRGKQKKKESKQSKKRQLLSVFRQSVRFLQIITPQQLDLLEDRIHIFVFSRGQSLAKEREIIDYIGVIAEGRAVAKGTAFQIGDLIGHTQILGQEQTHPKSIIAESDGVIVAIRIIDFISIESTSLRNRILNRFIEVYASQISKRDQISKSFEQFETVQQKRVSKYFTPQWSSFFSNQMDSKEKIKFFTYFPIYRIKQKDMIANQTLRSSLIYVIQGQIIAKTKQEQSIIESGSMHNIEGFIYSQNSTENVYCLSNDATVIVVDKQILQNSFKFQTFRALMKILLSEMANKYKKQPNEGEDKEGRETKSWSMFKKYPNAEILPLPKKPQNLKTTTKTLNHQNQNAGLIIYQTLFREQLGSNTKEKTSASLAESGYQKLYTLKTQSAGKEVQATLQLEKLRKDVDLLTEKLKFAEEMSKLNKLDLIENKSRVNMGPVLKQIRKLRQEDDIIRVNGQKEQQLEMGQNCVTLKQALEKQLKSNKIQMLVAKCAFKWLYLTRKRKGGKKD